MIRNLAIKGGGVRGIAFVGALRELDTAGMLTDIQRVAGTSAGAMVAAMVCAGYSVADIERLMHSLDFKKFEDHWDPFRVISHYGLYKGEYIIDFTKSFLAGCPHNLSEDTTFGDMRQAGCRDLYVFATNLNESTVKEFSADKTPGVKVAEAVRASMSIPLFFKAWQFDDGKSDPHMYVDGGVAFNYPLTFFDSDRFTGGGPEDDYNKEALGLFLHSKQPKQHINFGFNEIRHYIHHLFEVLLNTQDLDFTEDETMQDRSVMIDDLGIKATDFDLTADDMHKLVVSGSTGAKEYLQRLQQNRATT